MLYHSVSLFFYCSLFLISTLAVTSNMPEESTLCQHHFIYLLFTVKDGFGYSYRGLDSRKIDSPKLLVFALWILILNTRPCWADDQTDLWCNLCKPFAPCELENQRQDFRMALGQRLFSLCYLIANFHRLFSFTCLILLNFFPLCFLTCGRGAQRQCASF